MPTSFFNDLLQTLTNRGRTFLGLPPDPALAADPSALAEQLLSERGEASGVALAQALLDSYAAATPEKRLEFLRVLAERFGADRARLDRALEAFRATPNDDTIHGLHNAAEARRQELIRRLNLAPGGTAALVRMREDILEHVRDEPALRSVDSDFRHLFSSWFNRGFLVLRPIEWSSPAHILEKIIRYEAVHAISDWDDLRGRLEPTDRRCFAFFHPQLGDEPLIFVEVALTREIPGAITPLLAPKREPIRAEDATTAVFYSISNTQKGLAAISFGHFLIKQVVQDLKRDLPNLKTFVTLSPVPGFAGWLNHEREAEVSDVLDEGDKAVLAALDEPGWHEDKDKLAALRKVMLQAAAYYFLKAKSARGTPVDPVARFHLGNGARLEKLDFLGDSSPKGLKQSYGLMVNYLYALDDIEANHEAYARAGEIIAAPAIRKLLKADKPQRALATVTD
ncbi:Malonyl-CoA decarboxylase [Hyphomicrobiales bacterium]|nr:Malonyl-CoA decarboxylase [Hyphomicrobiales bacterium]CAH1688430.1 Malonyl-CoA decarboxylase [Hyphomicrobiales bacterium]